MSEFTGMTDFARKVVLAFLESDAQAQEVTSTKYRLGPWYAALKQAADEMDMPTLCLVKPAGVDKIFIVNTDRIHDA